MKENEPLPKPSLSTDFKTSTVEKQESSASNPKSKKWLLWVLTFILVLAGLIWFLLWLFYFQFYQSTDDAYAGGNLINVNPLVEGSVVAFYCDDTQLVQEGELIVRLDPTEFALTLDKEMQNLAAVALQVKQLYIHVEANLANLESKKAALSKAKFNYENRLYLHDAHPLSVSNEDFVHSRDDYLAAKAQHALAQKELKAAEAAAGNTPFQEHPFLTEQRAKVKKAFYQLAHCSIYAPASGYVAQRAVNVGQRVSTHTNLLAIIPTEDVWVEANYKETQLKNMRVGQPATITFDLYGSDIVFQGKVLGIASGTGSVFSLIPPQNATGNWIKIVQRLPVRISLDREMVKKFPIRLGISAAVEVDIHNQQLPMLAPAEKKQSGATTSVFEVDFTEIENQMNQLMESRLSNDENNEEDSDS